MKKRSSSRQNPKPVAKAKRAQQPVTMGMDLGDKKSRYCVLRRRARFFARVRWQQRKPV